MSRNHEVCASASVERGWGRNPGICPRCGKARAFALMVATARSTMAQRYKGFIDRADALLDRIRSELARDEKDRTPDVSDSELESMFNEITEMKENVEQDSLPPRERRLRGLGHMVIDQWPLGTDLGGAISELEQLYELL